MKKVTTFIAIMMLAFAVVASNVQAQTPGSSRLVVSPYYQADGDGSVFTFVGVSHPSLAGAASQIGLKLTAIGATAVGNDYAEFTLSAGTTKKVFIVVTNHSSLKSTSSSFSDIAFIAVSSNG